MIESALRILGLGVLFSILTALAAAFLPFGVAGRIAGLW